MSCAEQILAFVLIIFLFVGKARLGQLPIQPCGCPVDQSTGKQEGGHLAPNILTSVVMQGYVILC